MTSNERHLKVLDTSDQTVSVAEARATAADVLGRALDLCAYRGGQGAQNPHAMRATDIAMALARRVSPELADDPELEHGFSLHDIGMIAVSDAIVLGTENLTRDQLDEIQEHPWLGERIVARVPYLNGVARQVIAAHHERWDGAGYPRGLAGLDIPLAARIFAIVDAYDSMTTAKSHRHALAPKVALAEIAAQSGRQFDPAIVPVFLAMAENMAADAEVADDPFAARQSYRPSGTEG